MLKLYSYKKYILVTISILILLFSSLPVKAENNIESVKIEQVLINKPDVKVYFYLENNYDDFILDNIDITAYLENEKLILNKKTKFNENNEGISYIFLVDTSTSMTKGQINEIKKGLSDFINNMNKNDKFILISFGTKVEVLLYGNDDKNVAIEAISTLKNDQNRTLLFNALVKATELAYTKNLGLPERKSIIVITDAEDFTEGGVTQEEVLLNLSRVKIPIYGIGLTNKSRELLSILGEITRASGGDITTATEKNLRSVIVETANKLKTSFIVNFTSKNNVSLNDTVTFKMNISYANEIISTIENVAIRDWIPDITPPEVLSISELSGRKISITFSEDVLEADNSKNYFITDTNNFSYVARDVVYDIENNTAVLTFDNDFPGGNLSIKCINITDNSMEKNNLTGEWSINISEPQIQPENKSIVTVPPIEPTPTPLVITSQPAVIVQTPSVTENGYLVNFANFWKGSAVELDSSSNIEYIWIILLLAIILIIIIYQLIKRQGSSTNENKNEYLNKGQIDRIQSYDDKTVIVDTKKSSIHLLATTLDGMMKNITTIVNKSIIIGRSESCDISFDDAYLARRQFAINEEEKGDGYNIENLSTTNATYVNGSLLETKRKLFVNDIITAGKTSLTIQSL